MTENATTFCTKLQKPSISSRAMRRGVWELWAYNHNNISSWHKKDESQCHIATTHNEDMSPWHITIAHRHDTSRWYVIVTHHHSTSPRHIAVTHHGDTLHRCAIIFTTNSVLYSIKFQLTNVSSVFWHHLYSDRKGIWPAPASLPWVNLAKMAD